jgi:hypothetical protein
MHKEPNGTLVMTTCKCRENKSNLVMTRTWFEEQLQAKIELGARQERDRILDLLKTYTLVDPALVNLLVKGHRHD